MKPVQWMLPLCGGVVVACVLGPCPSRAESFDVRPIIIETRDGLGLTVVTNPGERRIYLESQVLEWSQDANGVERLVESDTAIASPPAMWVAPHTSYTMRIRLPLGQPDTERAFRVVLKQLPERSDIAGGHVVFALTQNLPAFVSAPDQTPPVLSARLLGGNRVLLQNTGGRRVRVTKVSQDGRVLANGLLGYALARGALAMTLPQPIHPGVVEVETDLGPRQIALR